AVRRADTVAARVARSVKSSMNDRWFLADVLHDVDLAAVGPAGRPNIVTQHPKCRPDPLAIRNLNSRLETSVGLAELVPGEQSCRSIVASNVVRASQRFL